MICERCHGTGMVRELADELPIEVWVPCGDCGGCRAAAAARLAVYHRLALLRGRARAARRYVRHR